MSYNQTRQQDFNNFANKDYAEAKKYAASGNVNPLNTLAHVANTASKFEEVDYGHPNNVKTTGKMYGIYNERFNKGGSSRKMRSYRNKSNKRNKRTRRTRRGKRRLH